MNDVLIVEPSDELALVIAQGLARKERTSALAHTAQAAIAEADKATPRLVILELLIHKHNGLEFIHEFRSYPEWLDIPIIIYSQLSPEELGASAQTMKDMGIISHLYKPSSSLETLIMTAEESLER